MTRHSSPLAIKPIALLLLSLILLGSATGQKIIDSSKLPECVLGCSTLVQAERLCIPPVAPAADQGTYQTCFCKSNYLVQWAQGTTAGVCDGFCPQDRLEDAQKWFSGLCNGGKVVTPPQTTTVAAGGAKSTGAKGSTKGSKGPSWISQHYKWVVMLIILILAAIGGTWLGIWLKRRSKFKKVPLSHRDSILTRSDAAQTLRNRHPTVFGGPTSSPPPSMSQLHSFTSLPGIASAPGSAGYHAGRSASGSARGNPGGSAGGGTVSTVGEVPEDPAVVVARSPVHATPASPPPSQQQRRTPESAGTDGAKGKGSSRSPVVESGGEGAVQSPEAKESGREGQG